MADNFIKYFLGYNCTADYCFIKYTRANMTCESIRTRSECENAAQQLRLSDVTVEDDGHDNGVNYDPPYCYFEKSKLKFNDGINTGNLYKAVRRLRECCRQVEAEVVSNSRNKNSPNPGTAL